MIFGQKKKQHRLRRGKAGAAVLFLAAVLTAGMAAGCGKKTAVKAEQENRLAFERPSVMLLVATERNRYEQIYTDQIWNVKVSEDGATFEDYLLEQVKLFATDLKVIGAMAGEQGISLDSSEKEQLRRLSEEYYGRLTEGDKAYTGAGLEDVQKAYQEYCLASKTVSQLTGGANLEISDSEAKVIQVNQIVLEDGETAGEIYSQVTAEGADFESIARAASVEPEITCEIGKGERDITLETAAFALEEGEISQVIESEGRYYILQCLNPYDQEATQKRKEELSLLRKDKAFREIYDAFLAEHPISISDEVWKDIRCVTEEDTSTTDFFELYQEYFPEK
ncbi:MAG: peptidylprolyl isomerase [Lachnospiraceae bacterium]|nr:peptidylprolyl isomerase [Lachnospiraceae bacterium]